MTVLHRLAGKEMVAEIRDERAFRYAPTHGRDELVARLMVDALDQVAGSIARQPFSHVYDDRYSTLDEEIA